MSDKPAIFLLQLLGELVVAALAFGLATVLLPLLTFGWVAVDWRKNSTRRVISRSPNGSFLIDPDLAMLVGLLFAIGAFIVYVKYFE